MKWLVNNFLKGCLVLFPIVGTVYAVYFVLWRIDDLVEGLVPMPYPGMGLLVAVATVVATGAVASNVIGARMVHAVEGLFERLPVVRLLYGSFRDLLGAFIGEKRGFDKPVVVSLAEGVSVFGFVTCDRFDEAELQGQVAVYLPQSYNFAGTLLIVPRERVTPVPVDSAPFLAFVASGGISRW